MRDCSISRQVCYPVNDDQASVLGRMTAEVQEPHARVKVLSLRNARQRHHQGILPKCLKK